MREHQMHLSPPGLQEQDASPAHAGKQKALPPVSTRIQDASTVHTGKQAPMPNDRTGFEPFPKRAPVVLPMSRLAQPKPSWQGLLVDSVSDLMHYQYRLSVLQWNPGPARKNHTQIIPAACGRFRAVILQEAGGSRTAHLGGSCPSHLTRTGVNLRCPTGHPRSP